MVLNFKTFAVHLRAIENLLRLNVQMFLYRELILLEKM